MLPQTKIQEDKYHNIINPTTTVKHQNNFIKWSENISNTTNMTKVLF